ncbi:MAG: protein kinase, partial [Lentisphaeria bacterium]|nr:protein kinase [Lentisphaeria bacterium]
ALRTIWNKYKMFHKDIKPGNIMLTRENEAMILDMGTAQERGKSLLADGDIEGSPYYMSPEQARGEELGWSSDQYSLGATMYQMVTGQYLYDGPDVEMILRQHDSSPFPDPAARMPELNVSEPMTAILRKMLEKKPAQRYASWEDFIRDAKKLLKKIIEEKGSSTPERLQRKYNEIDGLGGSPERKGKGKALPSPGRFICYGLLIFILTAALLGGIFLYLAIRKNSSNAAKRLEPIRKQAKSLPENPDAVDELIRSSESYFERFGVLPSLRRELEENRQKVEKSRELAKSEEQRIARLESLVAEQLKIADQEIEKVKETKTLPQAMKQYGRAVKILRGTSEQIKKKPFALMSNISRAEELQKRLRMALHAVQREQRQYLKSHSQPVRKPGSQSGNMKKPARPVKPAKPVPTVKKPTPQMKKTLKPPHSAVKNLVEREKNRLRVLLLEQQRKGQLTILPALHLKRDELSAEQQTAFARWLRGMKAAVESAARMHQAIYNSHQSLVGFHFTVPTPEGETRMELRSILRDEVILFR